MNRLVDQSEAGGDVIVTQEIIRGDVADVGSAGLG